MILETNFCGEATEKVPVAVGSGNKATTERGEREIRRGTLDGCPARSGGLCAADPGRAHGFGNFRTDLKFGIRPEQPGFLLSVDFLENQCPEEGGRRGGPEFPKSGSGQSPLHASRIAGTSRVAPRFQPNSTFRAWFPASIPPWLEPLLQGWSPATSTCGVGGIKIRAIHKVDVHFFRRVGHSLRPKGPKKRENDGRRRPPCPIQANTFRSIDPKAVQPRSNIDISRKTNTLIVAVEETRGRPAVLTDYSLADGRAKVVWKQFAKKRGLPMTTTPNYTRRFSVDAVGRGGGQSEDRPRHGTLRTTENNAFVTTIKNRCGDEPTILDESPHIAGHWANSHQSGQCQVNLRNLAASFHVRREAVELFPGSPIAEQDTGKGIYSIARQPKPHINRKAHRQ